MKKHLFLKSLLIAIGLLITSINTAWADGGISGNDKWGDINNPHHFYFDDSKTSWYGDDNASYVAILIGRNFNYGGVGNQGSTAYKMTRISNTKLYYRSVDGYSKLNEFLFVGDDHDWASDKSDWYDYNSGNSYHASTPSNRGDDGNKYTNAYCVSSGESFTKDYFTYCTPSGSANNSSITLSPKNSSGAYTALNKSITIKEKYNSTGAGAYAEVTSGTAHGTITVGGYAFDDWNSCSAATPASIAKETSTYSASVSLGRTSTITLTAGATKAGKAFVGWYRSNGNLISTNTTATAIVGASDSIYYAYYKDEETHNVTVSYKCGPYTIKAQTTQEAVGITTKSRVTAPDISGYHFINWTLGTHVTTSDALTDNPIDINTVTSGSDFTLTANYGVSSGWYLIGTDFGNTWNTSYKTYQFTNSYRGRTDVVYYALESLSKNYWKLHNTSDLYNTAGSTDKDDIAKTTVYGLSNANSGGASKLSSAINTNVWMVLDKRANKLWIQDPQTYHNVNVTGEDGAKGAVSVTLNSTSAFDKSSISELATTQFANGETFKVTVTGVSGWIPTITIGGTPTTFWKEASSYSATGTMSTSDVAVSISYTASYAVTFAKTTGCGTLSAKGPGDVAISTGNKVKSGTSITFTQTSTHSGYDFSSWNSASTGDGSDLGGNASGLTKSITAVTSVYPIYTVHTYTGGTLDKKEGGEDGSYSVTYLATSFASKIAPTRTGYNVAGYYQEDGRSTLVADASGNLKTGTSYTNGSRQWTYTSSIPTLYTGWTAKTYAVTLDKNGTSSGYLTNGSATATYDATSLSSLSAPTRTGYHVEGYYDDNEYSNKVATDEGALQSGVTGFTTGTAWTKDADATLYTKWTANSYTIKFDKNTDGLATYVGAVSGTTADKAATYDASCTLTSNGYSREGYEFRGWNTDADTTGTRYTDGQSGTFNFTSTNGGTTTLYAMWKSKTYTVTFDARGGSSLSASSATVTMGDLYINGSDLGGDLPTVTAPAGYVFQGWYTASSGGTLVTEETRVATASDHTLYAHYLQQTRVYFYDNLNWNDAYVTYDAYWDDAKGSGNYGKIYHHMTNIVGTNIWYDVIPEDVIRSWKYNICFNSKQLGTIGESSNWEKFNSGEAVFRRDFDSYATMFVPDPTEKAVSKNGTQYISTDQWVDTKTEDDKVIVIDYRYKKGYWRTYNEKECGYVVKGTWDSESLDHAFRSTNPNGNTFSFTRTLEANTDYYFRIYKHCKTSNTYSSWFLANEKATITSSITNWELQAKVAKSETLKKDHIKTTAAGDYTITIKLGTDGILNMDVTYPLVANDYRVLYSWNDGSAHEHASEIIKPEASSSKKISVFVHKVEGSVVSRSLKIQQCTAINASGVPTWTDCNTIDLSSVTASGVYNFVITQPAGGYPTGAYSEAYDGDYYIRTECAEGKWDFYKDYPDNKMTYSDYSMTQTLSPQYSHYFCRYFGDSKTPEQTDIAYTIANDYSPSISDTLVGDATIGERNTLPTGHPANVRFAWNEKTNALRRAYLKSATGSGNKRYLLIHGTDKIFNNDNDGTAIASKGEHADSLHANELQFIDKGNWIYQVELKAQPGAEYSLIAKYNGVDRDLIGNTASSEFATIIGGSGSNKYAITAVYDFKTNRLMTAWTPSEDITDNITNVDVMLIREGDGAGNAITFNGGSLTTNKIIGAIKLDYDDLVGRVADWTSASRPLLKYFISFPFAVNVSDIFGMGRLGREYIIQRYNGAERARKGFFRGDGTTTFWENLTADDVMNAYEGYCVIFDNDYLNDAGSEVWTNKGSGSSVYLYFPSADNVGAISNTDKTIPVPEHECKIERTFIEGGKTLSHQNTDSHWNLIGVPIFNNHEGDDTEGTPGAIFVKNDGDEDGDGNFHYYYEFNPNNTFSIAAAQGKTFNSMHCYMVQYHGDVTFTGSAPTPAGIAARRTPENKNYKIELQVTNGKEEITNHTYVELRENASDDFALNEDVYMDLNNVATSIYSYAGDYDVAANVLSVANHTVSVGINVVQEGMCTFSMPSNFSGTVTLIDKFAQTRTNLALEDYEVYLNKGAINDRFELEIDINKMPTAIDGVEGGSLKDGKAHKFIENGQMYILRDGKVFDAQGSRVK